MYVMILKLPEKVINSVQLITSKFFSIRYKGVTKL